MSYSINRNRLVSVLTIASFLLLASPQLSAAADGAARGRVDDRSSGWMGEVVRHVEASEYHVTWRGTPAIDGVEAGYSAPNRAQDLRFVFLDDGVHVTGRTSPEWVVGLHPESLSVDDRAVALEPAAPTTAESEVTTFFAGATLIMVNRPAGLGYAFRVTDPPGKGDVLTLTIRLSGDLGRRLLPGGALELSHDGSPVLRFGPLAATDALGGSLPVSPGRAPDGGFEIRVTVAGAVYPVTIEGMLKSISTSPSFSMTDSVPYARMGASMGTAGDVNGDGYSDVIIGFPWYDGTAGIACGMVRVYHGGPGGPGSPASPSWTVQGTLDGAKFGYSVSTAGDVNGDGYSDIIVGAPEYDVSGSGTREGGVWVYHGTAGGVSGSPNWYRLGDQVDAYRGTSVATAGDVNGDGYSDIVFSEPGYNYTLPDVGRVWVYHGGSSGLGGSSTFIPMGDQANARFGEWVATAGDVDGDGYADIVVGTPFYNHSGYTDAGEVRVYPGSSAGPATGTYTSITQAGHYRKLGLQVGTAGDVNGDGYADLIIGSAKTVNTEGAAYLYRGSASGIETFYTWSAEGTVAGDDFGSSVATAGDVNGDGYADVIIGARGYNSAGHGRAFVWVGGNGGLGANGTAANAYWSGQGDATNGTSYGYTVATAGDVNGDGYSDILVADPDLMADSDGGVYGYFGGPDSLSDTAGWTESSGQQSAQMGVAVATAGDVNGDGYADVIVGAEYYDYTHSNEGAAFVWYGQAGGPSFGGADWWVYGGRDDARLGHSVGTAGDVNGDGYSDVIIGAPDFTNGTTHEGLAVVFHGGASGIVGTDLGSSAWLAEIDDYGAQLGWSVGTAGDVNGDGYADVVVGAPGAGPSYQGKAFVWHGGTIGLGADGTAANADWSWIGSTASGSFGQSVGTAGDVNRDYYSDLIVGGDEVAVVWHGSQTGLDPSAFDWSYASSGLDDNDLGVSVGTAGDIGGDGYSDVVVGAPKMDSDIFTTDDGAVLVFCGAIAGLSTSPCFTDYGGVDEANLGSSVATAGDLNGDGISDVVAGARHWTGGQTWEGQARVYYGTIFGLWSADWSYESNQSFAYLGHAVGTAGDVNGDGYADLLIGGPGSEATYTGEGRVWLFYGNGEHEIGTGGRSRLTQQLSPTGLPVAPQGRSTSEDTIRLYHRPGVPSTGRGKVRVQTEVRILINTLDGSIVQNTTAFDTGTTGANIIQDWTSLLSGLEYHWRTRVLHSPVTNPFDPPRGPWFHIATFGENEAHFQTAGESSQQEHIFSDGFETGGTGMWSVTNP